MASTLELLTQVEQRNVQSKLKLKENSGSFIGCLLLKAETSQSVNKLVLD